MGMFCYQCEQTARGQGCTAGGVCGKDPDTAVMQDLLIFACKGVAWYGLRLRNMGQPDREMERLLVESLFTTITNVNFDVNRVAEFVKKVGAAKRRAKAQYEKLCVAAGVAPDKSEHGAVLWDASDNVAGLLIQASAGSLKGRLDAQGEDITGLQELLTYGLKGLSAYADHAMVLGREDDRIYAFVLEALEYLTHKEQDLQTLFGLCLRCGECNLISMELLNGANTGAYGLPVPAAVRVTPVKGKAILVSGHDLKDLEVILKETQGKGINVYTHGEMLPAHGYPKLKAYSHLVGNYGSAWQNQVKEFDAFPGAVLMTTNCIQKPRDSYKGRIFTTGLVEYPGVTHVTRADFSPVIEAALASDGFAQDEPEHKITVGFGHNAVLSVADKVVEAVKAGQIRHFFLIGGCDGAKPGRNYYTELAQKIPQDCIILTLACGKYRFNKLDFGEVAGLPRLLDVGQCNDAYSAIKIAAALADAFGTDVNGLPLSIVLSWYEQKAVAVLLTLLHLGIKDIRLGPSLPAYVTPAVLKVLVDNFNIMPISTPDEDLKAMLQ